MFCVSFFFFILDRLGITRNRIALRLIILWRTDFKSFANIIIIDWMIIFKASLTTFYIPGFILD